MNTESLFVPLTAGVIFILYMIHIVLFFALNKIKGPTEHKLLVIKDATNSFNAPYLVSFVTGSWPGAGTEGVVKAALAGSGGQRAEFLLNPTLFDLDKKYFRRGATDHFLLMTRDCLEDLFTVELQLVPKLETANWYLRYVLVENISSGEIEYFPCHQWIRCTQGQATKVVLVAGHSYSVYAKFRFLFDMLTWCAARQHCWNCCLISHPASKFNSALHASYRTCVLGCLLFNTATVYSQHYALGGNHMKTMLYALLPGLLIALKLTALERALHYFQHRSRFEKWIESGKLVTRKQLHPMDDTLSMGNVMDQLTDSLWQPYCPGDDRTSSQGFIVPTTDLHLTKSDDSDWSPIIDPQQMAPLSTQWMTSTPGPRLTGRRSSGRIEQPRQLALATDSDYALHVNEGHFAAAAAMRPLEHETTVTPIPPLTPPPPPPPPPLPDTVPLRLFSHGAGYRSTEPIHRNNGNNSIQHHMQSVDEEAETSFQTAIVETEPPVGKSKSTSTNSSDESKLAACYDNKAFDPNFNDEKEEASEEKAQPPDKTSSAGFLSPPAEIATESWVFVEKPMELVLKDALTPALADIVDIVAEEKESQENMVDKKLSEEKVSKIEENEDKATETEIKETRSAQVNTETEQRPVKEAMSTQVNIAESKLSKETRSAQINTETNEPSVKETKSAQVNIAEPQPTKESISTQVNSIEQKSIEPQQAKSTQANIAEPKSAKETTSTQVEMVEHKSAEQMKTGLRLTSEFARNILNPMLSDLVKLVQDSLVGKTDIDQSNLEPFKRQLTQILNMLKDSKNQDTSARIDIISTRVSKGCSGLMEGHKVTMSCHSDSFLDQKKRESSDLSNSFTSSNSTIRAARKDRSRSVEDIQISLDLGPVAKKISSMLIDYALTNQNVSTAYASKSQQERREMLASLRDMVNGSTQTSNVKIDETTASKETARNDAEDSAANPLEVMGRLPAKFTGKINDSTMLQIASASLQSILSDETRARFDDIVSAQCQNEALAFAEDVVNNLYEIVRDKLRMLVEAEVERTRECEAAATGAVGGVNGPKKDMQGLLNMARRDVKANVLPAVTEHIVRMLERQAKVLDELDVDLMMMLYGGQYVDTVITNAVLQTHVGLVRAAKSLSDQSSTPLSNPSTSTPKPNQNHSNNAIQRLRPTSQMPGRPEGCSSTNFAYFNGKRVIVSHENNSRMSRSTPHNKTDINSNNSGASNNVSKWASIFKVVSPERPEDTIEILPQDEEAQMGENDIDDLEVISLDANNNQSPESCNYGQHYATPQRFRANNRYLNTSRHNNTSINCDATMTIPDYFDVTTVTSRVLDQVHDILTKKATEDLSGLLDGEIHCGLCRPKAIKEIQRKVAAMAAGRHLTLQVYASAMEEMRALAGQRNPGGENAALATNATSLLESDLLARVGDVILQHDDDVNGEGQTGAADRLMCQETVERVADEILSEVMRRSHKKAAENLIAMLKLGEMPQVITGGHLQEQLANQLHMTLRKQAGKPQNNENSNAGDLLDLTDPLSEKDVQELSYEYEQIRNMLFEQPPETILTPSNGDQQPQHDVPLVLIEPSPPCTYYRHMYTRKAKYAQSHNMPSFYALLSLMVFVAIASLGASALIGLGLQPPVAGIYCFLAFVLLVVLHGLVLESAKVLIVTLVCVVGRRKLPS